MTTVWSAASRTPSGNVTISGAANLTASFAGSGNTSVLSSSTHVVGGSGGKFMFEITVGTMATDFAVGIADTSFLAGGQEAGDDTHAIVAYVDPGQKGLIYYNSAGTLANSSNAGCVTNDVVSFCVDTVNSIFWFTTPEMRTAWGTTSWNNVDVRSGANSSLVSPTNGTGGVSFSGLGTPCAIVFNDDALPASCTLNTGVTSFNQTLPSGFSAWDTSTPTPTPTPTTPTPTPTTPTPTPTTTTTSVGPGDIISGASFWYGLRTYNAAYATGSNPCCIVQRASDSTSATINILASGALDVATLTTFLNGTTGVVTTLYDQSGNGHTLTIPTSSVGPSIVANGGPNSSPWMVFGANSTCALTNTTGLSAAIAQPWTFAAFAERTGALTSYTGLISVGTSGVAILVWVANAANSVLVSSVSGSNVISSAATDGVLNSLIGIGNGATNSAMIVNGASTTGSAGTASVAAGPIYIGGSPSVGCLVGNVQECGLWPGAMTSTQYASLSANQNAYWKPTGGPYVIWME
jgi:Alpha-L-arabinofuranosidase B, catalytic